MPDFRLGVLQREIKIHLDILKQLLNIFYWKVLKIMENYVTG
nr:MAG TPA: hypothetical protein [Bacteriophage sp.]